MLKVGDKQNPYQMWQAGISLAASPLSNSSRSPAMESGGSAATRPPSHPASYAGYVFHAPCFPRPVLSKPCVFHTPCFPHPVFSTPGVFHTPCFPRPMFSTRPRVFHVPCFSHPRTIYPGIRDAGPAFSTWPKRNSEGQTSCRPRITIPRFINLLYSLP